MVEDIAKRIYYWQYKPAFQFLSLAVIVIVLILRLDATLLWFAAPTTAVIIASIAAMSTPKKQFIIAFLYNFNKSLLAFAISALGMHILLGANQSFNHVLSLILATYIALFLMKSLLAMLTVS